MSQDKLTKYFPLLASYISFESNFRQGLNNMLMQILSQSLRFSIFSELSTPYFHLWDEKKVQDVII